MLFRSVAALAAVALGTETVVDGIVSRRQEITGHGMSAAIAADLSAMEHELNEVTHQLNNQRSPLAMGVSHVAQDMINRQQGLLATSTGNTNMVGWLEAAVEAGNTETAAQATAMSVAVAASLTRLEGSVADSVASLTSTIDTRITGVLSTLATTTSEINAGVAAADATIAASVTAQIRAVNVSLAGVTTALAGKKDDALHIWIGSCSNNGNGGWREYCYNRVNVDTARPYFRKENDSRMRTITSGYFRMQFYRMFQSCNWEHTLLYFDGNHRRHTHTWTGGNSQWRDQDVYLTWPMAANKQSWARAWTCGWTIWNTSDH